MIHQRIEKTQPFGSDHDANEALVSVLGIVSQLSIESRKLAHTDFRSMDAEHRQREFVNDLRERVASAARRAAVDEAVFLEAARVELERRTKRSVVIHAPRGESSAVDDEMRRLRSEHLEAQIHEHDRLRRLNLARKGYLEAQAATKIATRAVAEYETKTGSAAR